MLADVFFDSVALIQPYVLGPPYLLNTPVSRNFDTNGASLILIICCVFRKHSTARTVCKEMFGCGIKYVYHHKIQIASTPEEVEFLKLAILKLSYEVKSQEQKVLHWKNSADTGIEMTVLFVMHAH